MRFDTVIRNGAVVTATDTSLADVGITSDKVTAIAARLPTENTTRVLDATGMLVSVRSTARNPPPTAKSGRSARRSLTGSAQSTIGKGSASSLTTRWLKMV